MLFVGPPLKLVKDALLLRLPVELRSTFTLLLLTPFEIPTPPLLIVPDPVLLRGDRVEIVGDEATLTKVDEGVFTFFVLGVVPP